MTECVCSAKSENFTFFLECAYFLEFELCNYLRFEHEDVFSSGRKKSRRSNMFYHECQSR